MYSLEKLDVCVECFGHVHIHCLCRGPAIRHCDLVSRVLSDTLAHHRIVTVLYYRVGSIYGPTSRDMRRLNSTTRSPLYSLFGETVAGVSVIRAFGASVYHALDPTDSQAPSP
jgi:hypothetical protein